MNHVADTSSNQYPTIQQLNEVFAKIEASLKDKPVIIRTVRYADQSSSFKKFINDHADFLRARWSRLGIDFDAWRSGTCY